MRKQAWLGQAASRAPKDTQACKQQRHDQCAPDRGFHDASICSGFFFSVGCVSGNITRFANSVKEAPTPVTSTTLLHKLLAGALAGELYASCATNSWAMQVPVSPTGARSRSRAPRLK